MRHDGDLFSIQPNAWVDRHSHPGVQAIGFVQWQCRSVDIEAEIGRSRTNSEVQQAPFD